MAPTVELTPHTFGRLQKHAVPLVDTIESVISRMIDAYEGNEGASLALKENGTGQNVRIFNASTPPDLTHAKILGVTFLGAPLGRGHENWNGLLVAAVREAKAKSRSASEFKELMVVNFVKGEKHEEGFRPIADIGISIQGQDANGAWRGASHIALRLGCEISVKFAWREKEGAAFPGVIGQFKIPSKS